MHKSNYSYAQQHNTKLFLGKLQRFATQLQDMNWNDKLKDSESAMFKEKAAQVEKAVSRKSFGCFLQSIKKKISLGWYWELLHACMSTKTTWQWLTLYNIKTSKPCNSAEMNGTILRTRGVLSIYCITGTCRWNRSLFQRNWYTNGSGFQSDFGAEVYNWVMISSIVPAGKDCW